MKNTTTGVDWAYDAKLFDSQTDDMFWMINDEKYTIQGSNEVEELNSLSNRYYR